MAKAINVSCLFSSMQLVPAWYEYHLTWAGVQQIVREFHSVWRVVSLYSSNCFVFDVFSIPLCSNYIAMKCKNSGVYQYAVLFNPDVDSLRMRHNLLEDQRTRDVIGDVKAFDGRILFLPIQLQNLVFWFICTNIESIRLRKILPPKMSFFVQQKMQISSKFTSKMVDFAIFANPI